MASVSSLHSELPEQEIRNRYTAFGEKHSFAINAGLCIALFIIAIGLYAGFFLHVPLLTEARDFAFRFGRDARLLDVWIPTGNDYRPFSWKLFAWQQQAFEFRSELFNLTQFILLGLCAIVGYIHLLQLQGSRSVSFGASVLWLFSLPVAHAAFWQATQHDKLAFIFTLLALVLTLQSIRSSNHRRVWILALVTLLLAAMAVSAKPSAFMLPIAFATQIILFTPGRTRSDYIRAGRIILVPAAFVTVYALIYERQMTGDWRAHTLGGSVAENFLIYIRNVVNIDYDGSLILAILLLAPIAAAWLYALSHGPDNIRRAVIYLSIFFGSSLILLLRAEHAPSFYLLLPMFAFSGIVATAASSLLSGSNAKLRRAAAAITAVVCIGLFTTYWMDVAGSGRLHEWGVSARNLAGGYRVIRTSVDPDQLKDITFVLPHDPDDYFYFFSDGTHSVIDPLLPSLIFGRPSVLSIKDKTEGAEDSPGLVAVWSDDLQLSELRLAGKTIYGTSTLSVRNVYVPGDTIRFEKTGNGKNYLGTGWSFGENWGTWTDGPEATIHIKFERPYHLPMELVLWGLPSVPEEQGEQSVQVLANELPIATWTFHHGAKWAELRARIPAEATQSDYLDLKFRIPTVRSPQSLGLSADTRALGIMVERIRINPVQ